MEYSIRECTKDDLPVLREISYQTYDDTFRDKNSSSSMNAYLEQAFDTRKLRKELSNSYSVFYFLYIGEELAGYLKLNDYKVQTDINDPQSLEIERIYIKKKFHGRGFGKLLLKKSIEVAANKSKSYIWLGVWEKNDNALSFYQKNGFYKMGEHSFFMGQEEQTDYLMRKDLTTEA
ncbi:GNAT family N-acetyltransferase [Anaerocolumna sedimenticola]|uniref:GNAT family N-acetyltransferase n=1 Tax=Anaerocolumna sedimenticola TaxID=2696063 RepID=A0A6P1TJ78_9FIRM|nr:GNAT family N-acetyltransferase [Anaerocolumna sedimenticola]QHQ60357.1 GNAT family N-acetyltransferase [Anaerocolumna sedimenticola]